MSIYYDIKEHLIIKNTEEHNFSMGVYSHRLVRIGALVLEDCARFHKLLVITDGKTSEFSGDTITEEFHNIIRKINSAVSVEIFADYGYFKYGMSATAPDALDMAYHLSEQFKEDGAESLNGLFYSIYGNADCDNNAGAIIAYGEKDGHLYTGNVENRIIETLPDGVWYSPQTAVVYDEDNVENIEEIASICEAMTKFGTYDELDSYETGISFYLNNLELRNNDELNEFIDLCKKLTKATDGECWANEFGLTYDGRIAYVKINEDGSHQISIQSVDF